MARLAPQPKTKPTLPQSEDAPSGAISSIPLQGQNPPVLTQGHATEIEQAPAGARLRLADSVRLDAACLLRGAAERVLTGLPVHWHLERVQALLTVAAELDRREAMGRLRVQGGGR